MRVIDLSLPLDGRTPFHPGDPRPRVRPALARVSTVIPFVLGLATATVIASQAPDFADAGDYAGGLVEITPGWFLLPVCIIAAVGGLSTGTTSLYGTGLAFSFVGLLFVNLPGQFAGPLRNVAEDLGITRLAGVDRSPIVALLIRAVLAARRARRGLHRGDGRVGGSRAASTGRAGCGPDPEVAPERT